MSRRRRHVGCLGESVGALCGMWLMCGHRMQRAAAVRCRARIAPASGLANLRSYPEPTDLRCGSGPTAAGNSRGAGQRRIHDDSVRHARPPIMVVTTSLIPAAAESEMPHLSQRLAALGTPGADPITAMNGRRTQPLCRTLSPPAKTHDRWKVAHFHDYLKIDAIASSLDFQGYPRFCGVAKFRPRCTGDT